MLFPELTLCGYPPEDLLLHRGLRSRVEKAFAARSRRRRWHRPLPGLSRVRRRQDLQQLRRCCCDGEVLANHRKRVLPNYAVFDEKRYFEPGSTPTVADFRGHRFGLIVCEDAWDPLPCKRGRRGRRRAHARDQRLAVSYASAARTRGSARGPSARERAAARLPEHGRRPGRARLRRRLDAVDRDGQGAVSRTAVRGGLATSSSSIDDGGRLVPAPGVPPPAPPLVERVYGALVLGTRDYVEKNGFPGGVLGLSGGVDSALTLCDRRRCARRGSRARGHDAFAVYVGNESRGRRPLKPSDLGVRLRHAADRADVRGDPGRARRPLRRLAGPMHRREHPGALSRHAAHGHLEQARQDAA